MASSTSPTSPTTSTSKKHKRQSSSSINRSSTSTSTPNKTEIKIHVYDLLPPGRLSSLLWTLGGSLLHTAVVIENREYAYGGHDLKNISGVYWTHPHQAPPGGTFRCAITHGFCFLSAAETTAVINEASRLFLGTRYNLLSNNCNHFTSYLCERLIGRAAPAWINRAASVGLALPCVVPREWISPPDHETADGELLDEGPSRQRQQQRRPEEEDEEEGGDEGQDDKDNDDETAAMLPRDNKQTHRHHSDKVSNRRITSRNKTPPPRLVTVKDSSGREMPVSERAPMPKQS
jgi:hypothetical protein